MTYNILFSNKNVLDKIPKDIFEKYKSAKTYYDNQTNKSGAVFLDEYLESYVNKYNRDPMDDEMSNSYDNNLSDYFADEIKKDIFKFIIVEESMPDKINVIIKENYKRFKVFEKK